MPLIECPDCGKQISDAAPACLGCGRPNSGSNVQAVDEAGPAAPAPAKPGTWLCGKCGSSNIKKYSLIHEMGMSDTSSLTAGLAVGATGGGMGVGVGGARTKGESATRLSQRVAPPELQKPDGCARMLFMGVVAVVVWIVLGIGWALGLIAVSVVMITKSDRKQSELYEEKHSAAMTLWDKKYLCMQCATDFQPPGEGREEEQHEESDQGEFEAMETADLLQAWSAGDEAHHSDADLKAIKRELDSRGIDL